MHSLLVVVTSILLYVLAQNPQPNLNVVLIQDMMYISGLPQSNSSSSGGGQQVALASYIDPLGDPTDWARLIAYPTDKLTVLVANVVNGPDSVTDPNWLNVIQQATATGKTVLGYVRTGYLGVSEQQYATRLNSLELADWVAQIEEDVDMWYNLYPGLMGGIFFDEGWNDCGDNNEYSDLYEYISQSTKRKHPGAFTVLNPGTSMPQCFENSADTLLTSETSYETYTTAFVPNDWTPEDPRKIWHIVYGVPDGEGPTVAALALERGAGLIEITDGVQPNPYDTLPADEYMEAVFGAIAGGTPLVGGLNLPPGGVSVGQGPSGLTVVSFEYTSVTLSWTADADAIGYRVYVTDIANPGVIVQSLDLPDFLTGVTVGGLIPGTQAYEFQVSSVGGDGVESPIFDTVQSGTEALPVAGEYVTNVQATPSGTSTIFQADVLVPFGFVRVYIWSGDDSCALAPGWPINYTPGDYICAQYMLESDLLYSYDGAAGTYSWSWAQITGVTPTQVGYTVTWDIPLSLPTVNTSQFVIQAQGYNPLTNVFSPCTALNGPVTIIDAHCQN